ncbi:NADH dehydrogenase [ubiquinone] 1 alpha subcomplex assembly factor 2-like [Rhopilema esculentum]|uniref:NADH dehydrogenase [ubiquinone] 1 alpha subcomplex assembly factor 2-like n=1 Tax=Rhopilema esculentum TaxID=499914 RepID=UPI0031DCCD83
MIRRILASLLPQSNVKRLVGVDHLGNKYYEVEKGDGKKRRFLERSDGVKPEDYVQGMIPNQWEAWIRGRTDTPPTTMELLEREKVEKIIAARGADVQRKDDEAQQKAYEDGLISRVTEADGFRATRTQQIGHASANFFGPRQQTFEPSTVGSNFEPGSWRPKPNTKNSEQEINEEESFKPESWTPNKKMKS